MMFLNEDHIQNFARLYPDFGGVLFFRDTEQTVKIFPVVSRAANRLTKNGALRCEELLREDILRAERGEPRGVTYKDVDAAFERLNAGIESLIQKKFEKLASENQAQHVAAHSTFKVAASNFRPVKNRRKAKKKTRRVSK